MRRKQTCSNFLVIVLLAGGSVDAFAHAVRNRRSAYSDNDGVKRDRYKMDVTVDLDHEGAILTKTVYGLSASQEQYQKDDITGDEYSKQIYGSRRRKTDALALSTTQTWSKVTDSRVFASYTTDGVMHARTGGFGISQWFWRENLQLSLDVSRTLVEQPVFETLGADSDVVSPPSLITSTGTTVSSKYLATPTTISTLSFTHVEKNDRPPANIYGFGIKQFVPKTQSAVHLDIARGFNQGRVTNRSDYGEVNAWIAELAFLQNLWRGSSAKAAYRYYKEDETTRVENDEYVRGSDMVSLALAQELTKTPISLPLVVEISGARYKTNDLGEGEKLSANIFELGLLAKF